MNKLKLLRVVNLILIVSFVVQVVTSLIMFFRIKISNPMIAFSIHKYNGLIMIILIMVHISLNWGWIKSNFSKKTPVAKQ